MAQKIEPRDAKGGDGRQRNPGQRVEPRRLCGRKIEHDHAPMCRQQRMGRRRLETGRIGKADESLARAAFGNADAPARGGDLG